MEPNRAIWSERTQEILGYAPPGLETIKVNDHLHQEERNGEI
jgi:hypothetical protein